MSIPRTGCLISAILLFAACLPAADVVLPPDVVRITPSDVQPLELVSQKLSDDGKDLTLIFKAEKGSFFVNFDFSGTDYKTATIRVKGAKDWQSIDYFASKKAQGFGIDLLHLKGATVTRAGKDCVMTFDPRGYKVLPPSGSLRYIALPETVKKK